MASGGRRSGGGERVLESRHVIGLFLLMLLFSGVFFALGYRMGLDQYSGQVRAAGETKTKETGLSATKSERTPAKLDRPEVDLPASDRQPAATDWSYPHSGDADEIDRAAQTCDAKPQGRQSGSACCCEKSGSCPNRRERAPRFPTRP